VDGSSSVPVEVYGAPQLIGFEPGPHQRLRRHLDE
jgi:hypothetical protein